jgi:hypothetical protein
MFKTFCAAVLLAATVALVSGIRRADASSSTGLTSPSIVARGKISLTGVVPQTTIFTPTATGLYRLSVYATTTTADPTSGSFYGYNLFWTDVTGTQQTYPELLASTDSQVGVWNQGLVPYSAAFQANAGTPVSYSLTLESGPGDNAVFTLYYTVERLE